MVSLRSCALVGLALTYTPAFAFTSYIAEWIRVNYTVDGNWPSETSVSQQGIVEAAEWFGAQGPWSVLNKTFNAPSGDPHDYLSWSPYWWADCSNAQNTTELAPEQVWEDCNYVNKDGQFSPDVRLVNNTGDFQAMADGVFYNVLAYRITGNDSYANAAAWYIDTWFVNNATRMNPNLNFAQVIRGANGSHGGTHTGVLDLHTMTKVVSGILVLRALKASAWTAELDAGMNAWCTQYLQWLMTNTISLEEKAATNNHGTFWYAQTASIQILLGQNDAAKDTLGQFFEGIYQNQITANGDQPLESARTRPYHYRAYNSAAIICIHRMTEDIFWDTWNTTTKEGATVKTAVDYAMTIPAGNDNPTELYPNVAAIAQRYGDADNKYASWLAAQDPVYPGQAYYFWNQPLSNSNIVVHIAADGTPTLGPAPTISGAPNGGGSGGSGSENGASAVASPYAAVIASALLGALAIATL